MIKLTLCLRQVIAFDWLYITNIISSLFWICTQTHKEWGINAKENWENMQSRNWSHDSQWNKASNPIYFYPLGIGVACFSERGACI